MITAQLRLRFCTVKNLRMEISPQAICQFWKNLDKSFVFEGVTLETKEWFWWKVKRKLNLVFALGPGIIAVLRFQNILTMYLNVFMIIFMYLYIYDIRVTFNIFTTNNHCKMKKYRQDFELYDYLKLFQVVLWLITTCTIATSHLYK